MSDLTEFLLARFAEDEEEATGLDWRPWYQDSVRYELNHDGFIVDPAFVRADCAAKREIVGVYAEGWPVEDDRYTVGWQDAATAALRALARPYSAHPDFREEWR
jgi:hypothetical protein